VKTRKLLNVGQRVTLSGSFGVITAVNPHQTAFPYTVLWEDSKYETLCGTIATAPAKGASEDDLGDQ
jgi:hypothetical protein